MQAGYRLRAAAEGDLAVLPEIERRAAVLFEGQGIPIDPDETREVRELRAGLEARGLWVAVDDADRPVGFALCAPVGSALHLEEIDVDPDHARRGIGTALVEHVCAEARRSGWEHVTLTTYAHVPWNAPFYERLGFRVLARGELDGALRAVVEAEAREIPAPDRRVAMRRCVERSAVPLRAVAAAWLTAVVTLSVIATGRPAAVLQWTRLLPGRDKTGHFLLMGGLALFAVLAFAGRGLAGRRVSAAAVLAAVSAVVLLEESVQWWLPRRNFSLEDLASSLAGVAVFGGIAALWRRRDR